MRMETTILGCFFYVSGSRSMNGFALTFQRLVYSLVSFCWTPIRLMNNNTVVCY